MPLSKTGVTGVQGITKAYYTFDKADVQRIDESKLTIKVETPENGKKLLVYGLNSAVEGDICWTTAYANTATNKKNTSLTSKQYKKGDVDGNGTVNVADIATLKKVIVGLIPLDSEEVKYPDVNGDGGTPNAADLAELKKKIAGLE